MSQCDSGQAIICDSLELTAWILGFVDSVNIQVRIDSVLSLVFR